MTGVQTCALPICFPVTIRSVILTAVVFVKEKEDSTWDIMLLMPVNAKIIILAKSFSQVIIVMVGIVISVWFCYLWCV